MSKKSLIFTLVANEPYLHTADVNRDFSANNEILFSAISDTYLPLLNMMDRLEDENVQFKIELVLSASVTTLLDDAQVQKLYIDHLDKCIALGKKELEKHKNNPELLKLSSQCLERIKKNKYDFTEIYNQNLLERFCYYAKKGKVELTATSASCCYLPHYSDITEALNAQVETGLYAHKHYFGNTGDGFYLPYMGWEKGFERILRSYGVNYTILDAKSLLFAKEPSATGIFTPMRTSNSLVLFGSDPLVTEQLDGDEGYIHNPVYKNQKRDIGYDASVEYLGDFIGKNKTRILTGYKYFAQGDDEEDSVFYDSEKALDQVTRDAESFYQDKKYRLKAAGAALNDQDCSLVCVIPLRLLGQDWSEGLLWLEQIIRLVSKEDEITLETCRNLIENQFTLPKITPYPCSNSGAGYGEDLIENNNSWMLRYARKATERMIDLTERFPAETGLKARLLDLGAKEVLLAQDSCWPKMLNQGILPDTAKEEFTNHIINFTTVFDSLASNTVSTEWLTTIEKEDAIFPWINYRVFSRKK